MTETLYACPRCRTEQTQSIAALLQAGTTHSRTHGLGVAIGSGGAGVGGFAGQTDAQTGLAQRLAPGPEPTARRIFLLLGIFLTLFGISMAFSGLTGCGAGLVVPGAILLLFWGIERSGVPASRRRWADARHRAATNWVCLRCGHDWNPDITRP